MPLVLIQCAFDYQCHSFLSDSDAPIPLTSCWVHRNISENRDPLYNGDHLAFVWALPKDPPATQIVGSRWKVAAHMKCFICSSDTWFENSETRCHQGYFTKSNLYLVILVQNGSFLQHPSCLNKTQGVTFASLYYSLNDTSYYFTSDCCNILVIY